MLDIASLGYMTLSYSLPLSFFKCCPQTCWERNSLLGWHRYRLYHQVHFTLGTWECLKKVIYHHSPEKSNQSSLEGQNNINMLWTWLTSYFSKCTAYHGMQYLNTSLFNAILFTSFKLLYVHVLLTIYINFKIKYRSVANEVQEATVTVTEKWQTIP